jgi:hypothetical protein
MHSWSSPRCTLPATVLFFLLAACGGGEELTNNPGPTQGQQAPDFSIEDVNPNSATSASQVSPRQHVGRISAWYFGHAT